MMADSKAPTRGSFRIIGRGARLPFCIQISWNGYCIFFSPICQTILKTVISLQKIVVFWQLLKCRSGCHLNQRKTNTTICRWALCRLLTSTQTIVGKSTHESPFDIDFGRRLLSIHSSLIKNF